MTNLRLRTKSHDCILPTKHHLTGCISICYINHPGQPQKQKLPQNLIIPSPSGSLKSAFIESEWHPCYVSEFKSAEASVNRDPPAPPRLSFPPGPALPRPPHRACPRPPRGARPGWGGGHGEGGHGWGEGGGGHWWGHGRGGGHGGRGAPESRPGEELGISACGLCFSDLFTE